ncbi:MAG: RNA polymerase sigma-70 factor [Agriterribacter sp.]
MYQKLTDEVLMQLLRGDDAAAFAEIYRRYWERLAAAAMKVINVREDVSDIVQEVFVSVWKRRQEIELKGSLFVYLQKSVRNLAIRYIEKNITKRNYLQTLGEAFSNAETDAAQQCELSELQSTLHKAVLSLPSKMHKVYTLSRDENMSYKEIADHLGIAENTVRKQLSNALKSLRASVNRILFILLVSPALYFF